MRGILNQEIIPWGKKILISILIIISIIGLILFPYDFENPSIEKQEGNIRVMTYNIKNSYQDIKSYNERKKEVINIIKKYKPDSIGLQEADSVWMDYLKENLEGYNYVGFGREDGKNRGEYVPIFYLKDKYELLSSETKWLSEDPDNPSIGWDAVAHRIYTKVTLKNKYTGEIYSHYNTHLDHVGEEARKKGLDLISSNMIKNENKSILTGDFNFLEGFSEYKGINKNLVDTKYLAEESMSFGTINYFYNLNFRFLPPIDFIFIKKGDFGVSKYGVIQNAKLDNKQISDHYAVFTDLY